MHLWEVVDFCPSSQCLQIKIEMLWLCICWSNMGWGRNCWPTCESWDLVIYWSPLVLYWKPWSSDVNSWRIGWTHQFLSYRNSSLLFILPLSKFPPSLPSVVSILRLHTTLRVKFLKLLVGGTGDNAENLAWCVLRQVFRRENASKTLCQKSSHFPNCLLLLATQEFMHVLWVRCPQSSRGGWDISPSSAVLRKQVSKIQMLLCLWNKVHQTYCQLFMLKSTLPLMLMVLWSINPC